MTVLAVPLLVLSTLAQTPAPRDLVARAVTAMGGETALRGLHGSAIDFYQAMFALGQEETPASPARANLDDRPAGDGLRGQRVLFTTEGRNPTGAVNKVRRVIAGSIGMTETNGVPAPDTRGRSPPSSGSYGVHPSDCSSQHWIIPRPCDPSRAPLAR